MDENKMALKIRTALKVFGWLAGVLGIVFFVVILVGGGSPEAPRVTSVLALVLGFFYLVFFFLISEFLRLLIKIEENTRKEGHVAE